MWAHRDFLYRRSHNGVHLDLAARAKATSSSQQDTPSVSLSTLSVVVETTLPVTPLTPVATTTADTPTTSSSSSPSPSPLSAPTTSSTSSPSSPSSTSKSSSSTSSPTIPAASSVISTPLTLVSTPTTHAASVSTRAVTSNISFTPTSSLSPSPTSSAGSSSGTNTGAIVGGIAGTLAGIAALGFLLMWCMRRQRNRDIDDFDAKAFKRQSAILVDDPVEPPRSYNPRPPTMIEHHNASPALAAQAGHGGQNIYGSYGGYEQQPPYAPSEMIQSAGSPQGYGAPPMGYTGYNEAQQRLSGHPSNAGYSGYDSQQRPARQSSNAAFLTRQPSSAVGYAPPTPSPGSLDPNARYIDLSRSSVSPYQAAQYADISRQLGTTDPNGHAPSELSALPEGPLPSPFDDPVEATSVPDAPSPDHRSDMAAPVPVSATPTPHTQGNATEGHQRPTTLYNEGDAYGGI